MEGYTESESGDEATVEMPQDSRLAPDLPVHPSHRVLTKGVWSWCSKCGARTKGRNFHLLKVPCGPLTHAGSATLSRIRRGLPPCYKHSTWGDEPQT